jgi:hypothetical protein
MAALSYPAGIVPQRRLRLVAPNGAESHGDRAPGWSPDAFDSRELDGGAATRIASLSAHRHRRERLARRRNLSALAVSAVILLATWGVSGVLAGLRADHLVTIPGARPMAGGYLYTVEPGDTVWSIATRLDPSGDPRPLVAQIDAHLHGSSIVPGEQIEIP